MLSAREIFIENARTFYNFRTGKPHGIVGRYLAISLIALVASLVFGKLHDNLYSAVIAVQSILIGFAFNVLIYLSANPIIKLQPSDFLEDETKAEKLKTLANEVFYNLSYFTMIATVSVVVAFCLIGLNAYSASFNVCSLAGQLSSISQSCSRLEKLAPAAQTALVWIAFVSFIDAITTFTRITKRMTYLFREKIALDTV